MKYNDAPTIRRIQCKCAEATMTGVAFLVKPDVHSPFVYSKKNLFKSIKESQK